MGKLTHLDVVTTRGETFTGEQSAEMAYMIYVRWGRDIGAAHSAWKRLHQIPNAPLRGFIELVETGLYVKIEKEGGQMWAHKLSRVNRSENPLVAAAGLKDAGLLDC